MKLEQKCIFCGGKTELEVDRDAYVAYKTGDKLAQEAFPKMNPFEREVMITGMCFKCQSKTFNVPMPGHEDEFGKRIGECSCCGAAIWEKDAKDGGYHCPSCHNQMTEEECKAEEG